uniref:Uncharacterized protein n=1 Tax=Oryza glaberrima TaxID=4538 RepID=I1NTP3_ORYGL
MLFNILSTNLTIEVQTLAALYCLLADVCLRESLVFVIDSFTNESVQYTFSVLQVDISRKIKHAFCPPKLAEGNPCLEYIKYIILPWYGKFEVVREKEDGGNKTFLSMEELTADYVSGVLHPGDMKLASQIH